MDTHIATGQVKGSVAIFVCQPEVATWTCQQHLWNMIQGQYSLTHTHTHTQTHYQTSVYQELHLCPSQPPSLTECNLIGRLHLQVHHGTGAAGCSRRDLKRLRHVEEFCGSTGRDRNVADELSVCTFSPVCTIDLTCRGFLWQAQHTCPWNPCSLRCLTPSPPAAEKHMAHDYSPCRVI